jgi:hypothetical protein
LVFQETLYRLELCNYWNVRTKSWVNFHCLTLRSVIPVVFYNIE